MPNEGRKLPTKIKELRGTTRADRLVPGKEIEFTIIQDYVPPPAILRESGARQWDIIIKEYLAIGMINTVDLPALTIYCAAWDDWLEAKRELDDMSEKYFTTETGYQQIRPQVTIMEKSKGTIDKFGSMFGFNPVSRSRIGMSSSKRKKDEFSELYD